MMEVADRIAPESPVTGSVAKADVRRRFELRLARLLLRRYAPPVLPPAERLQIFVTASVDRAIGEGFSRSRDVALFVAVSWQVGEDFHRQAPFPQLDAAARVRWMRSVLGEEPDDGF